MFAIVFFQNIQDYVSGTQGIEYEIYVGLSCSYVVITCALTGKYEGY